MVEEKLAAQLMQRGILRKLVGCNAWLADTSANMHIVNDPKWFTEFHVLNANINTADNSTTLQVQRGRNEAGGPVRAPVKWQPLTSDEEKTAKKADQAGQGLNKREPARLVAGLSYEVGEYSCSL